MNGVEIERINKNSDLTDLQKKLIIEGFSRLSSKFREDYLDLPHKFITYPINWFLTKLSFLSKNSQNLSIETVRDINNSLKKI